MIDKLTGERLVVQTDGTAGPYLVVEPEELQRLRVILQDFDISFDPVVMGRQKSDGALVNIDEKDIAAVQARLDEVED